MESMKSMQATGHSAAVLKVVLTYVAIAALWILLSDAAVHAIWSDPARVERASIAKGWVFVLVTAALLYLMVGRLLAHLQTARLREVELAEQQRKSSLLLDAIANRSDELIFAKDREGRYQLCNPAAARAFGKPVAAILGRDDATLFPAERAARYIAVDRKVISEDCVQKYEEAVPTPDGQRIFAISIGPLRDGADSIIGTFGIAQDVTAGKEAAARLERSEQRYRAVFQNAMVAIAISRLDDGKYLDVNQGFVDSTGYAHGEAVGHSSAELGLWAAPECRDRMFEALRANHRVRNLEARFRRKNGEVFWGLVSAVPVEVEGIPCILSMTRDINELRLAQEELKQHKANLEQTVAERTQALSDALAQVRASEERYEYAMTAASDGIWDWNIATGKVYTSPAYCRMLGYAPGELGDDVAVHMTRLLDPREGEATIARVQHRLEEEGACEIEFRLRCKDGSDKWILSRSMVVERDASGHPLRVVGTHVDLTARKLQEIQLHQAKEAAEAANVAKSVFLGNMSHELHTPLNGIMGLCALLRRRIEEPKQRAMLERIDGVAHHLLEVIDDILEISMIESGSVALEHKSFRMSEVLHALTDKLGPAITEKGLQLIIRQAPEVARLTFKGDSARLGQILCKLVANALKFTDAGRISVESQIEEGGAGPVLLKFEVQDTGIGIAADDQQRLFTAFEQADNSMTRKYGGTGLGLAISKRLVSLMGGDIGVYSAPGAGSCFWFTVRLDKA